MLDDIRKIKSGRKDLQDFGLTIGTILVILGCIALWRGKASAAYLLTPGAAFIVFAITAPQALKPFQKIWMALSIIIGFFVSHLILLCLFYLVITPIGLAAKLLGKDLLDQRIERKRPSYWHDRRGEVRTRQSYENQF